MTLTTEYDYTSFLNNCVRAKDYAIEWNSSMDPRIKIVVPKPEVSKVIFHPPATIVLWKDKTKTVVKCDERDTYDKMKGLALCFMKKALGNSSGEFNRALRKAGVYEEEKDHE